MTRADRLRWRDDQILAFLREHPQSTTQEVTRSVTPGCTHSSTCCHYSPVYSRLRALANQGRLAWHGWGEGPAPQVTTWQLAAEQTTANDLELLEQMWALPALEAGRPEEDGHG